MLTAGEATPSEIARLAEVDRQLVRYWASVAGLDQAQARERWLVRAWRERLKAARKA
jgi:hypothetical protein